MKLEKTDRKPCRVLRRQFATENSIICGTKNPSSLGCRFYELEGGEAGTTFVAGRWHEGHGHMMHGGFIAALLDEVMGRSINNCGIRQDKPFVTGEMTTSFCRPIAVGQKMYAFGRVVRSEGRRYYTTSEIVDEDGIIMARASGVYFRVDQAGDDGGESYKGLPFVNLEEDDPKML